MKTISNDRAIVIARRRIIKWNQSLEGFNRRRKKEKKEQINEILANIQELIAIYQEALDKQDMKNICQMTFFINMSISSVHDIFREIL